MLNPYGSLQGVALKAAITFICGTGFILIGFDQGVMGGIISSTTFVQQFNHPSTNIQGLISSMYDIGCFFGSLVMFFIGERLGRRKPVVLGCVLVVVGTVLQGAAFERVQLLFGRFVAGLGNGFNSVSLPIYQSEMQSHKARGRALTLETGTVIVGVALSNWICYGANFNTTEIQWRLPISLQAVFAVICGCSIILLPESPRWLIAHNQVKQAETVLARLAKRPRTDPIVQRRKNDIVATDQHEKELGEATFGEIFRQRQGQNLRRALLGMMPFLMVQMCGINAPSYYLPVLLEVNLGVSRNMALILAAAAATQYVFFAYSPVFYIDKWGRRNTMIWGSVGMSACMVILAITIKVGTSAASIVSIVFFFLFYDAFGMSYMAVAWVYASEVNSLRFRNKGSALGLMIHWICNFVIVMITPSGATKLGYRFYIIWAVINFAFIITNYLFMVETAGRTLEEIDDLFERHPGFFATSAEERRPKRLNIAESRSLGKHGVEDTETEKVTIDEVA